jgi:hypothetical protein
MCWFIAAEMCLANLRPAVTTSSCKTILAFSHYFTLLPPWCCVAYKHITISSSPTGHNCGVCEWHLHVVLAATLLLLISTVYSLCSLCVGSHTMIVTMIGWSVKWLTGLDAMGRPLNGMAAVSQLLPGGQLLSHVWKNWNKLKTIPISEVYITLVMCRSSVVCDI